MAGIPFLLPALGEGIREVRVLAKLKESGDRVERDEPLAEVETEKATFVIESPATGVVDRWNVRVGESYAVGTVMTTILPSEGAVHVADAGQNPRLSPRVRAWCRSRGIDPNNLPAIPALHPEGRIEVHDLERWMESRDSASGETRERVRKHSKPAHLGTAVIEMHANWDLLTAASQRAGVITTALLGQCTLRALGRHAAFGSGLGIAVALLRGGLRVAAIDGAPGEGQTEFAQKLQIAVSAARSSEALGDPCSVVLSDMSSFGVRSAAPIVVPPAVATLFIGEPFPVAIPVADGVGWTREFKLVLAFNHDLVNGSGAASFLRDIRRNIEEL